MINIIDKIDVSLSSFILKYIKNPILDKILSRLNRGETFFVIFILTCINNISLEKFFILFFHVGIITFFTDRFILVIKQKVSRKRPLIRVMEKKDSNPDMRHSFPSAHAANSMTAISLMVIFYSFPKALFLFSFLAGLGRLLTLHHFFSDVLGGWIIGIMVCILNILIYILLQKFNLVPILFIIF